MRRHHGLLFALAVLVLDSGARAQTGGTYNLKWSAIACGGGSSAGGTYSMAGTIGQGDAQSVSSPSTGGTYSMIGGFWPGNRCPADFNGDDQLSVQDIFDFLNAWFAGDPRADFNGVNGISVQDIFDFLNAWFAGCQ